MKERPNKDRDQRKPQQPEKPMPPKREDREGWEGNKPVEGDRRPGRGVEETDKNRQVEKRQGEDKQFDPKRSPE
jgi:hypothetical protein